MEVNLQEDLNAVNDQLQKLVGELNSISSARENLIQQIQNLNGVAMYLRGKLPPEEQDVTTDLAASPESDTTEESREYPVEVL